MMAKEMFIPSIGISSTDLSIIIETLKTGDQKFPPKGHMRRWEKNILGKDYTFECIGSLYMIRSPEWELSFTTTIREKKGLPFIYVISRNVSVDELTLYGDKDRFIKDAVMMKLAS